MKLKSIIATAVLGLAAASSFAQSNLVTIDYSGSDVITGLSGGLFGTGISNVFLDGGNIGVSTYVPGAFYGFSLGTNTAHHTVAWNGTGNVSFNFITESANGTPIVSSPPANLTPVPEPETYALMIAGLGALGLLGRRRQAR